MTRRLYSLAAALLAAGVAAYLVRSWLEARDDQMKMKATIAAQQQLIAQADVRERERTASLASTLATISELKRKTQTPAQVLRDLPQYLPLPKPIEMAAPSPVPAATDRSPGSGSVWSSSPVVTSGQGTGSSGIPGASPAASPNGGATIPSEDLKPLYDFVQDCRACRAQLTSVQADVKDEQAKAVALTAERDAAVRAAKGGSFWVRLKRNAKWLAIGVGVGVALNHVAH